MTGPRIPHPFDSSILDSIKEDAAQPQQMPDPMPNIPYTSMPKEAWQEYLQEKLHEHRAGLNPKAMLGIQKAVHALNQYESQAIAPTGGSLLMSELKGAAKFPENAVRGTAGLLDDLVEGKFNKANRDRRISADATCLLFSQPVHQPTIT